MSRVVMFEAISRFEASMAVRTLMDAARLENQLTYCTDTSGGTDMLGRGAAEAGKYWCIVMQAFGTL